MRDLWRGLAMLALDAELRGEVAKVAKFDDRPEYEFDQRTNERFPSHPKVASLRLRNQPNVGALRAIDEAYRKKKVYLNAYALAEINRWFLDGGFAFIQALAAFGDAIQHSVEQARKTPEGLSPGFLEAVGVMVADPEFRDMFGKNEKDLKSEEHLRGFGFEISDDEQAALRQDFSPSTVADLQADVIFRLGWPSSVCAGRLMPYEGMFHPNM